MKYEYREEIKKCIDLHFFFSFLKKLTLLLEKQN